MNKNQNLMNKTQLTAIVAEKTGISKADAAKYVNAALGTIADTLTEGVIPTGKKMGMSNLTAALTQYGIFVHFIIPTLFCQFRFFF